MVVVSYYWVLNDVVNNGFNGFNGFNDFNGFNEFNGNLYYGLLIGEWIGGICSLGWP